MTVLQANLKHLYQRKSLVFLLLLILAIFAGMMPVVISKGEGIILGCLLFVLMSGVFTAALQVEILVKPFSYCLPGHRRIPLKILIGASFVVSFLPSALFLYNNRADRPHAMLSFAVTYAMCLVFFWLGVWLVFRFRNWAGATGFIGFVPLAMMYTKTNLAVENFMMANWFLIILIGVASACLAYRFLSRQDFARKYCGQIWMGVFDPWNRAKMVKFQQIRQAEKDQKKENRGLLVSPRVESFFLGKIADRSTGDIERHIWSILYRSFAVFASNNKWGNFLLFMPLLVCFMCYMGPGGGFIYVFPGFMLSQMNIGIHSNLLTSGGRRERFYSALALVFAVTMLVVAGLLAATSFSILIGPVMPRVRNFTFAPLEVKYLFIPLMIIPVVLTISSLFPKPTMLSKIIPMIVLVMSFQILIFSRILLTRPILFGPALAVVGIISSWTFLVFVLRDVCSRRCLVGN